MPNATELFPLIHEYAIFFSLQIDSSVLFAYQK
jgi:hypothetical protein